MQYIGESEKSLATRFGQHKRYVKNWKFDKATDAHFKGYCLSDMQITL